MPLLRHVQILRPSFRSLSLLFLQTLAAPLLKISRRRIISIVLMIRLLRLSSGPMIVRHRLAPIPHHWQEVAVVPFPLWRILGTHRAPPYTRWNETWRRSAGKR